MTEPVAYLAKDKTSGRVWATINKWESHIFENIPLYTAEQLHPRVKMTKKQYNRLMWDKENTDLFQCLDYFYEHDGNSKFGALTEDLRGDLAPEDIARAWLDEETIEIVPTMKWFVRSKKPDSDGDFQFLNGIDEPNDWGYSYNEEDTNNPRNIAYPFDTKERAEEWKNPITEVVLLPIGDE